MTTEQKSDNYAIEEITYELQSLLIKLNQSKKNLKELKTTNKVKHHQTLMNVDYAYEILQRSVTLLIEQKHI